MPLNVTWTEYATANITGFYEAFVYFNSITGDFFVLGLLLSIFAILYIIFDRWGMDKALAVSGFISFVLTGILRATGQASDSILILFMFITAFGALLAYKNN